MTRILIMHQGAIGRSLISALGRAGLEGVMAQHMQAQRDPIILRPAVGELGPFLNTKSGKQTAQWKSEINGRPRGC